MDNDVNYNDFYKWYKSLHHGIYELQIDRRPDSIKATTLRPVPSKEYMVNPYAESTPEVYISDGKQVLISGEVYEVVVYKLNGKFYTGYFAMEGIHTRRICSPELMLQVIN